MKLVKFKCGCMDEFDVYGFKLFTDQEYNDWHYHLQDDDYWCGQEIYVGTNEYVEFNSYDDYFRKLTIIDIDKDEYDIIIKLFGDEWGFFVNPLELENE